MIEDKFDEILWQSGMTAKDYKFEQEVPNRPNPLKLSKWLAQEIEEVTEQIDKIENEIGMKCSCEKGCSACCNQLIAMSISECSAIQPYIKSFSKEKLEELKRKVLEQCDILEKNNLTNKEINKIRNEKKLQKQYFDLNISCVFLDEENLCSIYRVRPSLCWSYRNYGDKADCEQNFDVSTTIKYDDWESRVFERILAARPTKEELYVLPFAIKKIMGW